MKLVIPVLVALSLASTPALAGKGGGKDRGAIPANCDDRNLRQGTFWDRDWCEWFRDFDNQRNWHTDEKGRPGPSQGRNPIAGE